MRTCGLTDVVDVVSDMCIVRSFVPSGLSMGNDRAV